MGRPKKEQEIKTPVEIHPSNFDNPIIIEKPVEQVAQPVVTQVEANKASKETDTSQTMNNDFMSGFGSEYKEQAQIPHIEEAKRRGRKPGSKSAPKVDPQNFIPPPQKPLFVGAVINGAIMLTMIDIFFPLVISGVHNMMNKDKNAKIQMNDLRIPKDVKEEMKELCDQVIKSMQLQVNPALALLLTLATMYGTAYMTAINKRK